jgi:ABC-2 type transport system permease protein
MPEPLPPSDAPGTLAAAESAFAAQSVREGMRAAFLPDDFKVMEQNQEWDLGWVAVALLAWLVIGLVVSRLTFRWNRRDA